MLPLADVRLERNELHIRLLPSFKIQQPVDGLTAFPQFQHILVSLEQLRQFPGSLSAVAFVPVQSPIEDFDVFVLQVKPLDGLCCFCHLVVIP